MTMRTDKKMISKEDKKEQGRKNRNKGKYFEKVVRENLERNGWIVIKNSNNVEKVDVESGQTILFRPSKPKYNPFTKRIMYSGVGFPDYFAFRMALGHWQVQFVECKSSKYLSAEEKRKAEWIVSKLGVRLLVAYQGKKKGELIYDVIPTKELLS